MTNVGRSPNAQMTKKRHASLLAFEFGHSFVIVFILVIRELNPGSKSV